MRIKTKVRDFEVIFAKDFDFVEDLLNIKNYTVVVGTRVYKFYKEAIFNKFPKEKVMVVRLGEENKTIDTVIAVYKRLLSEEAKKNMTIISFGGGINQDVVGFAASTLYRGINWIYIPTTLLAMADSSIGLKTSLNLNSYKNVVGTFYPPSKIFINIDFLDTLPKLNHYSGIGEIIKFYLMRDESTKKLDDAIEKIDILRKRKNKSAIMGIIRESMQIKLNYMEGDELDRGKRNLLNYGHEFGHALESVSRFNVPHGMAILIGIIFANIISLTRGFIDQATFNKITRNLLLPNIFIKELKLKREYFDRDLILESMKKDKKRESKDLVIVLPDTNFMLKKKQDLKVEEISKAMVQLKKILRI